MTQTMELLRSSQNCWYFWYANWIESKYSRIEKRWKVQKKKTRKIEFSANFQFAIWFHFSLVDPNFFSCVIFMSFQSLFSLLFCVVCILFFKIYLTTIALGRKYCTHRTHFNFQWWLFDWWTICYYGYYRYYCWICHVDEVRLKNNHIHLFFIFSRSVAPVVIWTRIHSSKKN